jgi:hypothetical protein
MTRFKSIFLIAFMSLATRVQAAQLEALALNPAYELLATGSGHYVVKSARGEVLLLAVDNLQSSLKLRDSSRHLVHAEFSPEGKFLLAVFKRVHGKSEIRIYNVLTGQLLQKTAPVGDLQMGFWLDECRYAAIGGPLENGARLQLFKRPGDDLSPCSKDFLTQEAPPPKQAPLAFWKDANFNIWAYFKNTARDLLSWLGKGSFYDFQNGASPYFWFREASTPSMLFRADQLAKKIQPLRPMDHYVAHPESDKVYGVFKGLLLEARLDADHKLQDEQLLVLPKTLKVQSLSLDRARKRLIVRDSGGAYFIFKLSR